MARALAPPGRGRPSLMGDRSRLRNRIHKALDHFGLRLGGALTNILGMKEAAAFRTA